MKKVLILSAALCLLIAGCVGSAFAVGLKVAGPTKLTCDSTTQTFTGMYIYWRVSGGSWSDVNRVATADIHKTPFDVLTIIKTSGSYEFAASYYLSDGSESDLSNIVPLELNLLSAPSGAGFTY